MNEMLHSVINRGNGFATNCFPTRTSFVPDADPVAASLRAFLRLDVTSTDYYVVAALRTITAYPDLSTRFKERMRGYVLRFYQPSSPQVTPASLISAGAQPPRVLVIPKAWPPVFETTVRYVDDRHLQVNQGDIDVVVDCARSANTMRVQWPAELGIQGDLECRDWDTAGTTTIYAEPYGYPHALVAEELLARDDAQAILDRAGAWTSFIEAPSPYRKMALVFAALGMTNKAVFP